MAKKYGIHRVYEKLQDALQKRADYFPVIYHLANIMRSKPATAMIYFITLCIEDSNCALDLASTITKHVHLLRSIPEISHILEHLEQAKTETAETMQGKAQSEQDYEHLKALIEKEKIEEQVEVKTARKKR